MMNQPYAMNPYAAPQAAYRGPAATSHGAWIKWIYGGAILGSIALYILGTVLGGDGESGDAGPLEMVGAIAILIAAALFFARMILGLVWLHASWSAVPPEFRMNRSGRVITPGQAVGYMFIPFYNLYWIFACNNGLADAVDYALAASGSTERAPRGLITVACVCQVIPYVNMLIAPFVWFFVMLSMDKAKDSLLVALRQRM